MRDIKAATQTPFEKVKDELKKTAQAEKAYDILYENSKKLDEALSKNFDSVKYLLSDGYVDKTDNGLFDELLKDVTSVLDTEKGYFSTKSSGLDSQITSLNKRIESANTRITKYETRITKQFNAMDSTISKLSSQLSSFQSYFS